MLIMLIKLNRRVGFISLLRLSFLLNILVENISNLSFALQLVENLLFILRGRWERWFLEWIRIRDYSLMNVIFRKCMLLNF